MSYAEIATELEKDFNDAVKYQIHLPVKKYIKEAMSRPDKLLVFKTQEWTSHQRNKLLLTPVSRSRQDTKKYGPKIYTCCVFLYKGELNMAIKSNMPLPWNSTATWRCFRSTRKNAWSMTGGFTIFL